MVNEVTSKALNLRTGGGWSLGWVGGFERDGRRRKQGPVLMHGGYPQELKLCDEN